MTLAIPATVRRNYVKILFPITVFLLFSSLVYIWTIERMPRGPNLCKLWKARYNPEREKSGNYTKQWWEWACQMEADYKKGNEYDCSNLKKKGNYYLCFDEPYVPKPPCLVYSFGIDNDFRFDDAMAEIGCEVFSFDPSMGIKDHQRSERVRFLNIGLATKDSDSFIPVNDGYTSGKEQTWKIRTIQSIRKMLGHEKRTLDVLKMDIETYEWAILKQMLETDFLKSVKQLTLEWHIFANEPMRTEFQSMYETHRGLRTVGFRQFYVDLPSEHRTRFYFNMQTDNSLVNTMFEKQG